jgi:hypothetical protein
VNAGFLECFRPSDQSRYAWIERTGLCNRDILRAANAALLERAAGPREHSTPEHSTENDRSHFRDACGCPSMGAPMPPDAIRDDRRVAAQRLYIVKTTSGYRCQPQSMSVNATVTNVIRLPRASRLHLRVFWSCCRAVCGHKAALALSGVGTKQPCVHRPSSNNMSEAASDRTCSR